MIKAEMPNDTRIRVAFVDSRPVVGDLFVDALEQMRGITVSSREADVAAAVTGFSAEVPDVVIVGVGFIGASIEDAIGRIHAACPRAAVLAIVRREGDKTAFDAIAAGAMGTFTIEISNRELQRRVRSVHARQLLLPPDFVAHVTSLAGELPQAPVELSDRQAMALSCAQRGLSYAETARRMGTSGQEAKSQLVGAYRTCREALRAGA